MCGSRIRPAVIAFLLSLVLAGHLAWAQAEGAEPGGGAGGEGALADNQSPPFEMGFHVGNLLPNQINGVTEIMGLGGVRLGFRMNPGSYFEAGFITGNGEGQEWKNIHADLRMDVPFENMLALAYIGADNYYYKGRGTGQKLVFGAHAGGGLLLHLTGATWFRTDMKFSISPGTSLYFGFGLTWRL